MKRAFVLIGIVIFSLYLGARLYGSMKNSIERHQSRVTQIAEFR